MPTILDVRQALYRSTLPNLGTSSPNTTLDQILSSLNSNTVSTATPSTLMLRDSNSNVRVNSIIENYSNTLTSGGTTVLTVNSAFQQYFTGTNTQTIQLPSTSTMVVGQQFQIVNASSGSISVVTANSSVVLSMAGQSLTLVTVISTASDAASSWAVFVYQPINPESGTSIAINIPSAQVSLGTPLSSIAKIIIGSNSGQSDTALTGTTTIGMLVDYTSNTYNTSAIQSYVANPTTTGTGTAGAAAINEVINYTSSGFTLGTGSTVQRYIGFYEPGSQAHIASYSASFANNSSFLGNWFINQSGSDPSVFTGNVSILGNSTLTFDNNAQILWYNSSSVVRNIMTLNSSNNVTITGADTGGVQLQYNNGNAGLTLYNNGNVGIGTVTPQRSLEIDKSGGPIVRLQDTSTSNGGGVIEGYNSGSALQAYLSLGSAYGLGSVGGIALATQSAYPLILGTNNLSALTIDSSQNVTLANPLVATSGGTSQSTYSTGDILYASASNTLSKLPIGTTNQILTVSSGKPAWQYQSTAPQVFSVTTVTSGTYTPPLGTSYFKVKLVGGGGGGGGGSSNGIGATDGSNGSTSSLIGSTGAAVGYSLTAFGGVGGVHSGGIGGNGGSYSLSTPTSLSQMGIAMQGGGGAPSSEVINNSGTTVLAGGMGGASAFGNGNGSGVALTLGSSGSGFGAGGGGGGVSSNSVGPSLYSGSGGGAGGYFDVIIPGPLGGFNGADYFSYVVGDGGAAGSGTSGEASAGSPGIQGVLLIEAHFQ